MQKHPAGGAPFVWLRRIGRIALLLTLIVLALGPPYSALVAAGTVSPSPFANLTGRWIGEGRLGFKGGKVEAVKCRATYFVENQGTALRQTIRCASQSGKIELKIALTHADGKLSGVWKELLYDLHGDISGDVTPRGFRVQVKGEDLAANMEVAVKDSRQIVEVHFDSATLIGLTLLLKKG